MIKFRTTFSGVMDPLKYHYVREALSNGVIDLAYCPTEQMTADILTKPVSCDRFDTRCSGVVGV